MQLFVSFGLLYAYCIGPFVSYLVFAILCGIIPVIFVACFFMMPESPYHLLKIGKRQEAINALAWLRCKSPASVQKEADEMQVCNGKIIKRYDPRVVQKRLSSVEFYFRAVLTISVCF